MRIALVLMIAAVAARGTAPTEQLSPKEAVLVTAISASGRCVSQDEEQAPKIAPGAPPLLSFRYYEGAQHHRFGNSELLLDDAGH